MSSVTNTTAYCRSKMNTDLMSVLLKLILQNILALCGAAEMRNCTAQRALEGSELMHNEQVKCQTCITQAHYL
jgi:hypothetical protein